MKYQGEHPEREISPRTKRNFYHAFSHSFVLGSSLYFVNLHTDRFRLFPQRTVEVTEWWDLASICEVKMIRFYWLWFGLAKVTPK